MSEGGIFVLGEITGEVARVIRDIQEEFDPKLAAIATPPHVTIVGSSGTGPIVADTSVEALRAFLEPISRSTRPLVLDFGRVERFMQTNIVVLPLSPYGPLRELHERIATSGLRFKQAKFAFTPHCTLSLYPTLTPDALKRILKQSVKSAAEIRSISVYHTVDYHSSRRLLALPLDE